MRSVSTSKIKLARKLLLFVWCKFTFAYRMPYSHNQTSHMPEHWEAVLYLHTSEVDSTVVSIKQKYLKYPEKCAL